VPNRDATCRSVVRSPQKKTYNRSERNIWSSPLVAATPRGCLMQTTTVSSSYPRVCVTHVHRDQASRPDETEALAYRRVAIRLVAVVPPTAVHAGTALAQRNVIQSGGSSGP